MRPNFILNCIPVPSDQCSSRFLANTILRTALFRQTAHSIHPTHTHWRSIKGRTSALFLTMCALDMHCRTLASAFAEPSSLDLAVQSGGSGELHVQWRMDASVFVFFFSLCWLRFHNARWSSSMINRRPWLIVTDPVFSLPGRSVPISLRVLYNKPANNTERHTLQTNVCSTNWKPC